MAMVLDATNLFLNNKGQVLVHLKFLGDKVGHQTLEGWSQVTQGLMQIISEEFI
jgi:hypothetical protein